MGRVLQVRGVPGTASTAPTRQLPESVRTFRMPLLPPKFLASPFLGERSVQGVATSLLSVPPKQRRRQRDTDFVLPIYERLLRPQHKISPQGGSRRKIFRGIAPPAGSPLPPLPQQAPSPTNRRNLGLIRPPTLAISQLAPRYFFPPELRGNPTLRHAGSPGWERIPLPRRYSLAGHGTGSA